MVQLYEEETGERWRVKRWKNGEKAREEEKDVQ